MGKMIDFHTHRRILAILAEMQVALSGGKKRKEAREPKEYLTFFAELRGICREYDFRQAHYGKILERLTTMLEKAARKGHFPVKKELRQCEEMLSELAAGLKKEKNIKKGIVFLPYLASMWDCMESVWQAADSDKEHCNAYIMPIPYCNKNEDGTPNEWFLDVEKFPPGLPLLPWDKTDLSQLHPDIIVIHNPYEDRGRINCVDARYYPSVLKHCTDKLVYIPYFIVRDKDAKNPRYGRVKTLANASAFWHSDVIIMNTRAEKEAYIKVLEEWHTRKSLEKRIFALGSPKIDKLLHTGRDKKNLPEKWQEIIGGRKVILYNTSIQDFLDTPELFMEKIRDTLEYFRRERKAVLWWRPHPLLLDSVKSMYPELLPRYEEMVKNYREKAWGIYDESGDMYRAIAWSDAYYGDPSSVAVLYSMTGKPLLISDCKIRNCGEEEKHGG